jgi:monofunctional biosynthetic peptidoglycan transglycosylase
MIKKIFIIVLKVIFCLILFSIVLTAVYTVINPPVTPLMLIRSVEYITEGKSPRIDKHWRSYDKVSKKVYRAVISAEDARFMRHRGFDWKAI